MGLISGLKAKWDQWICAVEPPVGVPALLALTPEFDASQHQEYVDCLVQTLTDNAIRNIALTGRYGAGKSSVLQKFAELHADRMLTLSLSTLGPADPDESPTNQIEKELVKQLLHSRPPRDLPQSRYRRITSLSIRRAGVGSAVQLAVLGGLLWFLGLFPQLADFPSADGVLGRVGAFALFAALAVIALTWLRLAVHNRVISSVSAAGASISLTEKESSYFDKYLDEIVYYFELRPVDVVVFEDLDRFNDPQIFEAARELNALLNAALAPSGKTVKFIYALKDSIFEQLGHDTVQIDDDAAGAEAVRANRTKFFDLVIPIVPFITHRTSRDLLTKLLADESLLPVSPELIDLTARHITDMRLLKNIRNEYAVFAARLITAKHGVPKLRADSVFAMTVYKNIHLADFEQVQLGRSDLDGIYRASRDLVSQSIASRRNRLRRIADSEALTDALQEKAEHYGSRLARYFETIRSSALPGMHVDAYTIGGETYKPDAVTTESFWRALFKHADGVTARFGAPYQGPSTVKIGLADIRDFLLGELEPDDWDARARAVLQSEHDELIDDIEVLRRADFLDLAARPDFTVARRDEAISFGMVLTGTLRSEVARDLVRRGFIDQNFSLYVAQYYGDRVSVAAMTFIVQHVQPNIPDFYYPLPLPEDVASVLRETSSAFLDQDSAYNIAILDFLLADGESAAADTVLERIVRIDGPAEAAFLEVYLTEGVRAPEAVRRLAMTWPLLLERLIRTIKLTPYRRRKLVNEAIGYATRDNAFEADGFVEDYLRMNYAQLEYLVEPADHSIQVKAVRTLSRAGVVVDDLAVLHPDVLGMVVDWDIYTLTTSNLRLALHNPETISLDRIRTLSSGVYDDCMANPRAYLDALAADENTTVTVADPAAFADIVTGMAMWGEEAAVEACRGAAAGCQIVDLMKVPSDVWSALALSRRFPATLMNVIAYMSEAGGIDHELGGVLIDAGIISGVVFDVEEDRIPKFRLAVAIINSSDAIPDPSARVKLVASLKLGEWIDPARLEPEKGDLLGELIGQGVCEDGIEVFRRFQTRDWPTLRYAIERSEKFADFVVPELLDEAMTAHVLIDSSTSIALKVVVLARLEEFVPTGHSVALGAAGEFAAAQRIPLDVSRLTQIADATRSGTLVMQLIDQLGNVITPADTLTVLVAVGGTYAQLATPSATFDLPKDSHHSVVLNRLKRARLLAKVSPRRTKPTLAVVVAD